jgi:cell division protein FtsB
MGRRFDSDNTMFDEEQELLIERHERRLKLLTAVNRIIAFLIVVGIVAAAVAYILPELKRQREAQAQVDALRRQVEARRIEVARQTRQVSWLQNNPEYLGIYARDKFDLMKEGETVFRVEPTKPDRVPGRPAQSPPE